MFYVICNILWYGPSRTSWMNFCFWGLCWTGESEALIVTTTSDLGTKFNLNPY
jgi:hypothetical protein